MKQLINLLKELVGRHLSREEMENAAEENVPMLPPENEKSFILTELRKLPQGEFVKSKKVFEQMTIPDVSLGWSRAHTGYYPVKSVSRIFDRNGKIIHKQVVLGNRFIGEEVSYKIYNPAGRWIGKWITKKAPRVGR